MIVVFTGPIAVGKSSVRSQLEARFGAEIISTRDLLQKRAGRPLERTELQALGAELDGATDGGWLAEDLLKVLGNSPGGVQIIDSVRFAGQLRALRETFGEQVFHVHMTASDAELRKRFAARDGANENADYDTIKQHQLEAQIETLGKLANLALNTDRLSPRSIAGLIAVEAGLVTNAVAQTVDVIVGAQFGSEGKGNFCAHLANDYDLLIRVGGPNAGHKVPDPPYTFVQLPSGTAANPQARIMIGAGAVISEEQMRKEIGDQGLTPERLAIDENAMMIEQSDIDQEEGSFDSIGSTKKGIGFATARKVIGRDRDRTWLGARVRRACDIDSLKPFIRDTKALLEDAYARGDRILLEGTQGTDLSLHHGPYPHVTSRETTASGCLADAGISPRRVRRVIMVTRTYPIRVGGTSGDLPGEIDVETIAARSGLPVEEIRRTEIGSVSGKPRRIAEFDWEQVRRSAALNGVTDIALSFADYLDEANTRAHTFDQLTPETKEFIASVERTTGAPVSMVSVRFAADGVLDRRTWK